MIPLMDLTKERGVAVPTRVMEVIISGAFVNGPAVGLFEAEWGRFNDAACASCGNGTDALRLALQAVDVKAGDEVIVPAVTFGATAEAVAQIGAKVVFADVHPDTMLIDWEDVFRKQTDKTRAVVPVHLFGRASVAPTRPVDMYVIEDAAQAHGNPNVGWGDLAAWSFFPSKPLGCFGDGGAVTGDSEWMVERVRHLRSHGMSTKYEYDYVGWNSRLDTIQAAVLVEQLKTLQKRNEMRRAVARKLWERLQMAPVALPPWDPDSVWHLFVVKHPDPEGCIARLKEMGVSAGRYYHVPLHRTTAYRQPNIQLPASDYVCSRMFAIPCYAYMTDEEIDTVAEAVMSL